MVLLATCHIFSTKYKTQVNRVTESHVVFNDALNGDGGFSADSEGGMYNEKAV